MLTVTKRSAWTFVTSSSGALGVEFVLAEGGTLYLRDPNGASVPFRYGAVGDGLDAGFRLPKIGKPNLTSRTRAWSALSHRPRFPMPEPRSYSTPVGATI